MSGIALLHFQEMPDGSSLAVGGEHVLQYFDVPPPSFVPQPGGRRGVVGVAALSWSGVDHAPVAVVDALFSLDLTPRPAGLNALLLVRGSDGSVAALLTSETSRPPRYETLASHAPIQDWEVHPLAGNLLRRCPRPLDASGRSTWLLDANLFFNRLSHS